MAIAARVERASSEEAGFVSATLHSAPAPRLAANAGFDYTPSQIRFTVSYGADEAVNAFAHEVKNAGKASPEGEGNRAKSTFPTSSSIMTASAPTTPAPRARWRSASSR